MSFKNELSVDIDLTFRCEGMADGACYISRTGATQCYSEHFCCNTLKFVIFKQLNKM